MAQAVLQPGAQLVGMGVSSPLTSSPSLLVVGLSLMMTARSKKSRTACLLVRVETWAPRRWTTRSGDLEVWITEEGPCPSARKFSSAHQSTHCSHSQCKLHPSVVSSALFSLITITQKGFSFMSPDPKVLTAAAAGRYILAGCQDSIKLLFPSPSPLQTELRRQQEDCVPAGHFCVCGQQWLSNVAVFIQVSCQLLVEALPWA